MRRASRERWPLVVASACDGVTDVLTAAVEGVAAGALAPAAVIERLRQRHEAVRRALGETGSTRQASSGIEAELARLERTLRAVARARAATPAERDLALAAGERLSLPLVTAALAAAGVRAGALDAARLVRTDGAGGSVVAKQAEPMVVISGTALELLMRSYGRRVTQVEVTGDPQAVHTFESSTILAV